MLPQTNYLFWAALKLHGKVLGNNVSSSNVNDHHFIPAARSVMHQEEVVPLSEVDNLRRQLVLMLHPHFIPALTVIQFWWIPTSLTIFIFSTDSRTMKVHGTGDTYVSCPILKAMLEKTSSRYKHQIHTRKTEY